MSQLALPAVAYTDIQIQSWRNKGFLLRLLELVVSHDRDWLHCNGSNGYLAGKLKCSADSITRGLERLSGLGTIVIEHISGIERRVSAVKSVADLRKLLWPARRSTPAQRARQRATQAHSHRSGNAAAANSFSPVVAEGSADTVAEGQIEETPTESHMEAPLGRGTDNRQVHKQKPGIGIQLEPAVVSALCAVMPEGDAMSIATEAAKSSWSLERIQSSIRVMAASVGVHTPGAWLRSALRAGNWLPPLPKSTHPSDRREKPSRTVTTPKNTIPWDWVPGADYSKVRVCANQAVEQLIAENQWPVPTEQALTDPKLSVLLRDRVRALWAASHPANPAPWAPAGNFSIGRPAGPARLSKSHATSHTEGK